MGGWPAYMTRNPSKRRRTEREQTRLTRLRHALETLNERAGRVRSVEELLNGACEILVASGEFDSAAVRHVERGAQLAGVIAFAGPAPAPRLERVIDLDPRGPDAHSPVAIAYSTGRPALAHATAAFPLHRTGECVAVLVLHSADMPAFDAEGAGLLERIAAAISQGLDALAAQEGLQRFRLALDHSGDMIVLIERSSQRIVDVNETACRELGYRREELLAMHADELIAESREALAGAYHALVADPSSAVNLRGLYRRADGSLLAVESTRRAMHSGRDWIVVEVARDTRERDAAADELRRREQEFRTLVHNSPDGIMRFDAELRCTFVNPAIEKSTGWPATAIVGLALREAPMPTGVREIWEPALRRALAEGAMQTVEFGFAGPRGPRHYQARFAPEAMPDGTVTSLLVITRDITDQKRVEHAIAESETRLRRIVEAAAAPLLLVDPKGTTLFANPAAAALFGRSAAELEGSALGLPLVEQRPSDVEIPLPGGGVRSAEMRFNATQIEGRPVLVVSLHDLSERKRYEAHIQQLANHDALTGLANRTLLRDRAAQAIAHGRRHNSHVGLIVVDIDQFKLVNDSWGHAVGDKLLLEVGNRLQGAVREGDTVARLGGDEFVIVLVDLAQPGDTAVVARKIADALTRPVRLAERELQVSASMGISLFPGDGEDFDALLQCADAAMYRAKEEGRDNYQYYSAEMGARARARVETEAGLRQALERDELRMHFQPQVNFATGEVAGFEALLRWERPGEGLVSPASFIPVAEDSGLIVPIGEWALRSACRSAVGWAAAGFGPMKVAVNLSARQFWQGCVTQAVRAALEDSGLPPALLELEITESVVARDLEKVMRSLEQLRRMGVSVAIDDFGTGYSSLAYLRSLPIQKLKIDRSFIQGIPADPEATALVGEIIRLAHVLSLTVVAEGVETQAQAAYLRAAGCEAMQGFLFSRPLPAAEALALLRSRRRFGLVALATQKVGD